jgi:ABC-type nitrate/sulfonate/bicarbonate transport system ATPase subunit/ABC-type transporter Mla maintaining outer membrane lipid asymmetry permease subunit MlaE
LGKTTLAMVLTGLANPSQLRMLDVQIDKCTWDSSIPPSERCGVLFQQTTLLDELTIAGNLQLALKQYYRHHGSAPPRRRGSFHDEIKKLLDIVGLDYARDAHKRPTELSGGMGRRASLALQLAQHKRVIVLDEPFTGLDYEAAVSVAKELVHLRRVQQTALLLISHEPHLAQIVLDPLMDNHTVTLNEPPKQSSSAKIPIKPSLFGTTLYDRFFDRLLDYTLFSLPLISMAFIACGIAIGMLTADLLARLDVADEILDLVDTQIRPMIKLLTGEEANAFQLMGVRFKVRSLLHQTVPPAKAHLFAIGMTKLMVLEIGPLLTALLLCGRIGGSYAGQVGTLHATQQTKLLKTLGISPLLWTWWPSVGAALIASPLLTSLGTAIALGLAGYVGPVYYHIGTIQQFQDDVQATILPKLRLGLFLQDGQEGSSGMTMTSRLVQSAWELIHSMTASDGGNHQRVLRVTYPMRYVSWIETLIEVATYPPMYHFIKAIIYGFIILSVAQGVTESRQVHLTPRGVPSVITMSVVLAGLLVIVADWGFSQLWLLRY